MSGNFFRGTTHDQDSRFSNKDQKLLMSKQWPAEFDEKVDLKKVDLGVINPWISRRVNELLGFDDEIVSSMIRNTLETFLDDYKGPDPRQMQITFTGFLERKTGVFMLDLWKILLEAQQQKDGIPKSLVEQKKEEYNQKKEELKEQVKKLESLCKNINKNNEIKKSKSPERIKKKKVESSESPSKPKRRRKSKSRSRDRDRERERRREEDRKRRQRDNEKHRKRHRSNSHDSDRKHKRDKNSHQKYKKEEKRQKRKKSSSVSVSKNSSGSSNSDSSISSSD